MRATYSYRGGALEPGVTSIVREFPLKLIVNGREIATLICSPHELTHLVVGFLRSQGFVESADDLLTLSVCDESGIARATLRRELPARLRPVLTSGCGSGISFELDEGRREAIAPWQTFRPFEIFWTMEQLARLAEDYRRHGGIHSAAAGNGSAILLFAEDLGRHNTIDRIAGEALLNGVDLSGTMLVTSGRVSTEMVAKAARLGVSLIASRTSPTDMAVRMCEEARIVLVGYVRGDRFTVYAGSERIDRSPPEPQASAAPAGGPARRTEERAHARLR